MTTWYDIPPPAHGYWYDLDSTVRAVLDRLRLLQTHIDEPRIRQLVPVAATMIDNELDRVNPLTNVSVSANPPVTAAWSTVSAWDGPTPTIIEALIRLTVDVYTGVVPFDAGGDLGAAGVIVAPHKSRFGIA
jgi:hypothetical protein